MAFANIGFNDNAIDILRMNEEDKDNTDPFKFKDGLVPYIKSINTLQPMHLLLRNYIYSQSPQNYMYHNHGTSIRGQDTGPLQDAVLGINIFMGGINSHTGFTSEENDFVVISPPVLFRGKQKFTCRFKSYPVFTMGPATVRSDAETLPAESFSVEFSVDMFAAKISIEPEANLLCLPEARLSEYLLKKEQVEMSLNQTMQEQITHALANCPTLTHARLRENVPNISKLFSNRSNSVSDFVYSEIQKEATDFCSWTLNPIAAQGQLQDLYESLMKEERSASKPNYIVTTPETAGMIATNVVTTPPTDVLYTVRMGQDHGEFYPGQILPYEGVSKQISLKTSAISVNGNLMPILKVPHLNRESGKKYNTFEHLESFWVFNEIGYYSKCNASIQDYKSTDRTKIRVTDLHNGSDGTISMDECLKKGGGLLPATYNRYEYDTMLKKQNGLLQYLENTTNERGLIDMIGDGSLPNDSPYNLFFPSSKVRFVPNSTDSCHFRSTGIFGNRPSFENWHPPSGDVEAAKDWMAKMIHMHADELDLLLDYLKHCSEIVWTKDDLDRLYFFNKDFRKASDFCNPMGNIPLQGCIRDMISNKGYTKFICIPRIAEALATIANKMIQDDDLLCQIARITDREDILMKRMISSDLQKIVDFRATLFNLSKKLMSLAHRVDLPYGFLTTCPPILPVYDLPDRVEETGRIHQTCEGDVRQVKAAYTLFLLCIAPLVFRHVYTLVPEPEENEDDSEVDNHVFEYTFINPDEKKMRAGKERETFLQPVFLNGFLSSVSPSIMLSVNRREINNFKISDVTAYDPLYSFDVSYINDNTYDRSSNFFDHFVSHRYQYLRDVNDERFAVKVITAYLNMISYVPSVESSIGHTCLMNRKYRIIRQCGIDVDMVGMYRGGKDNMMYAVGNLSTITKQTANNGIMVTTRVNGNCFIIDPQSSGRVIPNAVAKRLSHGMTSKLANIHAFHLGADNLGENWWNNLAFVVEALPGQHPLLDQHHFIPLNGRHLKQNLNRSGFDLRAIDEIGKGGGWVAENMYSLAGYSEAHLVFGQMFYNEKKRLCLFDDKYTVYSGISDLHQRAVVKRSELANKVVEQSPSNLCHTVFTGASNIGFLERQLYNVMDNKSCFIDDCWPSKSPLKSRSCSDSRFVETLYLNHRGSDFGLKVLDESKRGFDDRTQPFQTGVKGQFTTENRK